MFFIKSAFCRIFQEAFHVAIPLLPYREPEIISSCANLHDVFIKEKTKSIIIVTDKGIVDSGLTDSLKAVLKENSIPSKRQRLFIKIKVFAIM